MSSTPMSSTVAHAASATRDVLARGRTNLGVELTDARDRFIASDPGLFRLRRGLGATLAVGTTVFIEWFVMHSGGLHGQRLLMPVMMGATMAQTTSTSVRESSRWQTVKVCAGVPIATSLGLTAATLAHPVHLLLLVLFVALTFVAVWIRQFGPRWSTWGFLCWQSYFFALFLGPALSMLPWLVLGVTVSATWVGLLLATVLHDAPASRLRRIITALRARLRGSLSACLDLMSDPQDHRAERQLRRSLVQTSAVSLLLEAQIGQPGSLPDHVPPARMRRWLLDLEIALEEVAGATIDLCSPGDGGRPPIETLDAETARLTRSALRCLGWAHYDDARSALRQLPAEPHQVHRLAQGAQELLDRVTEYTSGRLMRPVGDAAPGSERDGEVDDDAVDGDDDGFENVLNLVGDNLPGTQALAKKAVGAAKTPVYSDGHLAFATRQAIQAACAASLAVGLGELISPRRFYWAAIAAFLTFVGASTSAETARRALGRTTGTMLGLVVSVLLGDLVQGNIGATVALGLVCTFCAFYLQPLSYAVMIFFITLQLGQLYELLHTFTDQVMLVRLAETAVGAASGILATFVILPVTTRGTAKVARQELMRRMAELLDECSDQLWGLPADRDVAASMVQVANAWRLAATTRSQLLRPRMLGGPSPAQQHLTNVLAASSRAAGAVGQAVLANPQLVSPAAATACRALADECRRLAGVDSLLDQPRQPAGRPTPADAVEAFRGSQRTPTTIALNRRIQRLADALTLMTPRGRIG